MSEAPRATAHDPSTVGSTANHGARLSLLYDLGCAFAAHLELTELVPLVIEKCRDVLDAEGAALLVVDPDRNELFFPYASDADPDVRGRLAALRFPVDSGIAGAALRAGSGLRIDDAQHDPRFYGEIDRSTGLTTRSMLVAPLRSAHGNLGVIEVLNRRGGESFTDDDLRFLEALAGSIAVAIDNARLYATLKESEGRLRTEVRVLRRDLARRDRFTEIIGVAGRMAELFHLMESAATSPITVLIEGETGTGKELVARAIHRAGGRAKEPFVAINCAALSESLLESELFGHRRGAFTGALQDHRGVFEAASGGTIFLDEVGEMSPAMQAKLLRVLEEGEVVPVGETRPRKVDVRVISATNRDLAAEVEAGRVRADLYYRLSAFPIRVPTLRERAEDIPLLVDHFLAGAAERHRKRIRGVDPAAVACLVHFRWPGNVRELENEIERAVALACDGDVIRTEHLSAKVATQADGERASRGAATAAPAGAAPTAAAPEQTSTKLPAGEVRSLRGARAAFEARFVAEALRQQDGNVSRTARVLGLSRVMLQKKMKEYGLR